MGSLLGAVAASLVEAVSVGPNNVAPQANHDEAICVGPLFSCLERPTADAIATVVRIDGESSDLREWLRLEHVAPIHVDSSGQPPAGVCDEDGAVIGLQSIDLGADGFRINGVSQVARKPPHVAHPRVWRCGFRPCDDATSAGPATHDARSTLIGHAHCCC